jgi:hypothetical protein
LLKKALNFAISMNLKSKDEIETTTSFDNLMDEMQMLFLRKHVWLPT